MDDVTRRHLAENEVIFRSVNTDVATYIAEAENGDTEIHFYCECSHTDCTEKITLTAHQYIKLHRNKRQFITLDGHELPEIEKIVRREKGFNVIEKYADPPADYKIKAALKKL